MTAIITNTKLSLNNAVFVRIDSTFPYFWYVVTGDALLLLVGFLMEQLRKTDLSAIYIIIDRDFYTGVFVVCAVFDADSDNRNNSILDYFELCYSLSRCAMCFVTKIP